LFCDVCTFVYAPPLFSSVRSESPLMDVVPFEMGSDRSIEPDVTTPVPTLAVTNGTMTFPFEPAGAA